MTRDKMLGMSLDELVREINHQRRAAGLSNIAISTRPSSSAPGKTTLEVFGGEVLFAKSISGGAISFFLKGMLAGFGNSAPPKVSNDFGKIGARAIDWRD